MLTVGWRDCIFKSQFQQQFAGLSPQRRDSVLVAQKLQWWWQKTETQKRQIPDISTEMQWQCSILLLATMQTVPTFYVSIFCDHQCHCCATATSLIWNCTVSLQIKLVKAGSQNSHYSSRYHRFLLLMAFSFHY